MKRGTKVTLSESEQGICWEIADARTANNRAKGVKCRKRSGGDPFRDELEGVGAEMAFCKLANVYPDFSVHVRSAENGTDEHDAKLHSGHSVDVKSTKYKSGRLLVLPWKRGQADYYVLMVGAFPNYEFKGAIQSCLVTRKDDLGYGECFVVEQHELSDLE